MGSCKGSLSGLWVFEVARPVTLRGLVARGYPFLEQPKVNIREAKP